MTRYWVALDHYCLLFLKMLLRPFHHRILMTKCHKVRLVCIVYIAMDTWFSSQIGNSMDVITLFLCPQCSASTTLCTHKNFHRQTNFSNTGSERILILENLGNVKTNNQTNKQISSSLEMPFLHSSATSNKRATCWHFLKVKNQICVMFHGESAPRYEWLPTSQEH